MDFKNYLIKYREILRYNTVCRKQREKLKNHNFSWLSSNCTGAIITHELQCKFNSPTVNLYMEPKDFLTFVSDIQSYAGYNIIFDKVRSMERGYPVGTLKDVTIFFVHYQSEEEASKKWKERFQRINYDNLFVMMSERDGCTYEDLKIFDALPFKNKIVLTRRMYPEIKSSVYIAGFEDDQELGDVFRMKRMFSITKYYDSFDFVKWLNGEGCE